MTERFDLDRACTHEDEPMRRLVPIFVALVLPFLVLEAASLPRGEVLGFHHFRQADTVMTAWNFAFHDGNLLRPMIDGVTWGKTLYPNEFPLYPWLVGMIWRQIGEGNVTVARCLTLVFAILALWYHRRLAACFIRDRAVLNASVVVMSMMPVMLYFSSAPQRQTLLLFTLLFGTYHLVRYQREGSAKHALLGTFGWSLAILLNPPVVYMAVPLAWVAVIEGQVGSRRGLLLGVVATIALVPALLWYASSIERVQALPTASMIAIADPVNQRNLLSLDRYARLLDLGSWWNVQHTMRHQVLPPTTSVLVCLCGIAAALLRRRLAFFLVWLVAVGSYFLVDFHPIGITVHHYYYLHVAPPLAVFTAHAVVTILGSFSGRRLVSVPTAIAVAILSAAFLVRAPIEYRNMIESSDHLSYYEVRDRIVATVGDGARVLQYSESRCPLLSYLVNDRLDRDGKNVRLRLVSGRWTPFEKAVADRDFDYLLLSWEHDPDRFHSLLATIRVSPDFGTPIALGDSAALIPATSPAATTP